MPLSLAHSGSNTVMSWNRIRFSRYSAMGNMVRVCGRQVIKHFECTSRNECRNGTPFDHPHNQKFAKKFATDALMRQWQFSCRDGWSIRPCFLHSL